MSVALLPPFMPPIPPQASKRRIGGDFEAAKGAGIQTDIEHLRNDWLALGDYLNSAITDYERTITQRN